MDRDTVSKAGGCVLCIDSKRTHIRVVGKAARLNMAIKRTFLTHVDALLS